MPPLSWRDHPIFCACGARSTKEAQRELRCLVVSTGGVDCSSVRKRAGRGWGSKGGGMGAGSHGVRGLAAEKDPTGEVRSC